MIELLSCQDNARGCASTWQTVPYLILSHLPQVRLMGSDFGNISLGRHTKWYCLHSVVIHLWISVEQLHEVCLFACFFISSFELGDDLFLECTVCLLACQVNSLECFTSALEWQLRLQKFSFKTQVFWDVMPSDRYIVTEVLKEHTASFSVGPLDPEYVSPMLFQN